jgi:hypothetical protein
MSECKKDYIRVSYFQAGAGPAVTFMRQRNGRASGGAYSMPSEASLGRLWRVVHRACYYRDIGRIEPWFTRPGWSWYAEYADEQDEEGASDDDGN